MQRLDSMISLPRHEATARWSSDQAEWLGQKSVCFSKDESPGGIGITEPVIMMTFVSEPIPFALLSTAIPSTPGILRSVITRSKGF